MFASRFIVRYRFAHRTRGRSLGSFTRAKAALVQDDKSLLPASSGGLFLSSAAQDAQNFLFAHDDELFTIQLDFGSGILAEQDAVALFHIERTNLALFVDLALANRNNLALLRLIFRRIRYDDSAAGGFGFFYTAHQDAVVEWGKLSHRRLLSFELRLI